MMRVIFRFTAVFTLTVSQTCFSFVMQSVNDQNNNKMVMMMRDNIHSSKKEFMTLSSTLSPTDIEEVDTSLPSEENVPEYKSPGEFENTKFQCDENVKVWADLNRDGTMEPSDRIAEIVKIGNRFASKGGEALNYWLRHNIRTGYFVSNSAFGVFGSSLHERLVGQKGNNDNNNASWDFLKNPAQPEVISRILLEASLAYEQDYKRISDGKYKLPYDMYTLNRQNSPIFAGQQTIRFVNEAIGTIARSNRGTEEDKRTWLTGTKSSLYPDYYHNAFHYQTDGWMSSTSANVYETSTETLFLGRQDAMQRTALAPLVEYANDTEQMKRNNGRPLKVLEVACGTGRFLTFARDNLPAETEFAAVDLSPFYLDKARDNDKNWRSIRKQNNGSDDVEPVEVKPLRLVQAKAEDLPFSDEEFDVVMCIYLYHEVPRKVRSQISKEMARVTKGGGLVIFTDSIQLGDRPSLDATIGNFGKMNEPHYVDYTTDCLPKHFENSGLECLTKSVCSTTKTLTFKKPQMETTSK